MRTGLSVALLVAVAGGAGSGPEQANTSQRPALAESITVERILVDVRVVGRDGKPVRGLGPGDFRVTVADRAMEIASVDWIDGVLVSEPAVEASLREREAPVSPAPASAATSLTVLFFQRDLEPLRATGLMRALPEARRLVAALREGDRMAVLAHDTRLHLLADVTSDRERLAALLEDTATLFEAGWQDAETTEPAPANAGGPALADTLTPDALARAARVETALLRLGEALERLPGPKDIVFFAWGMGLFGREGVTERPDYRPAIAALRRARASLLTIDVAQADWHSLEQPLRTAARETGGVFVKNYPLRGAVETIHAAVAGRYVLALRPPAEPEGRVRVRVVGRRGTSVFHPDRLAPAHAATGAREGSE